jgi:NAD(P)H-dependent FMN reductase
MKLVIFNGSPRNRKSNSKILIEHFLSGYNKIYPEPVPIYYLANRNQKEAHKEIFRISDTVIVIFPLYTDCMPGIVKEFFEDIAQPEPTNSKKLGFIVHSGFPEAIHSTFIERYLRKLTMRLNCAYLGTIIKGGVEGIQIMPPLMTRKIFGRFEESGEYFARNEAFSPGIQDRMQTLYKMSFRRRFLFNLTSKTGLTNFYWNSNLKRNNAYRNRFDKPFEEKNYSTQQTGR